MKPLILYVPDDAELMFVNCKVRRQNERYYSGVYDGEQLNPGSTLGVGRDQPEDTREEKAEEGESKCME